MHYTMNNSTTIKISKKTKSNLEKQKNHPGETYEVVLARLLRYATQDDHLSQETIKDIEQAVADIKAGRVYTTEQLNKELDL